MKKLAAIILCIMLFSLSGCSFEFRSIPNLMRPPLTATEEELEESIKSLLGSNISLRSPESGFHHSAITLHDLDGDKKSEAIIFYVNENDISAVRMSVLKKTGSEWALVSDFAGNGSGIYSIEFYDLNSDGCDDMLVSWYLFEDRVNKTLTVYSSSRKGSEISFSACATEPYNLMHVEDILGNGEKQIVLVYTDIAKKNGRTHIRLMSLNDENRVILLSETKLDERIISLSAIKSDRPEELSVPRIYIDAEIPESQMITEVLCWNKISKNFKSLIAYNNQNNNDLTVRSNNLYSTDIDEDGIIEIPLRELLAESKNGDTSLGYLLEWCSVNDGKLEPKVHYLVNLRENYRLFFPKEYIGRVFVRSDNTTGTWNFVTDSNKELFEIAVYSLDEWDDNSKNVTETLYIDSDKVYACTITEAGEEKGIKANELVKYFSLNV